MAKTIDKIFLGVLVILMIGMSGVFITALSSDGNSETLKASSESADHITEDEAKMIALVAVPGTIIESELEKENGVLVYEVEIMANGKTTEIVIDRESGQIISMEAEEKIEEEDVPITGSALEMASQAALDYIGEGRVTDSEIGDEEGYYEIEITLDNGDEVDVHLDEHFNVLSVEYD